MKHFGDITKLNGHELPLVDVVTGGSPCQDLSVAGARAGLAGERSGLFMEQIRVIKEMRDECIRQLSMRGADEPVRPRYMVWENVVGAFSSNGGEDFRAVLEETAKVAEEDAVIPGLPKGEKWRNAGLILGDGWSIAWRLHDSQWWGVPQRRRRLCVLADFNGDTAGKILFELRRETSDTDTNETLMDIRGQSRSEVPIECESLQRDLNESGETWKGTPQNAQGNADETISFQERAGCEGGVREYSSNTNEQEHSQPCVINSSSDDGDRTYQRVTGALMASGYNKLGTQEAMNDMYVVEKIKDKAVITFEPGAASRVGGHVYEDDVSGTVRANAGDNQQAVCLGLDRASFNQGKNAMYDISVQEEIAQPIVARGPGGVLQQ